ncbi:hypothetical protein J3459_008156 [Metarhizium acridum]|nr:hypothetical protein J3459_008156 [Metarhizium acridum]
MDVRTPSPHDAIYRDNFQPYHAGGPLLVYGTERFVSGNNNAPILRFFDFRFPKPYFITLRPCRVRRASHGPKSRVRPESRSTTRLRFGGASPGTVAGAPGTRPWSRPASDKTPHCGWGTVVWTVSSRWQRRPDASDKFYLGLRGAIVEAQLVLEQDIPTRRQSVHRCPAGWRVSAAPNAAMANTGISLCTSSVHEGTHGDLRNGMPEILHHYDGSPRKKGLRELLDPPEGTRFDTAWRQQAAARHRGHSSRRF